MNVIRGHLVPAAATAAVVLAALLGCGTPTVVGSRAAAPAATASATSIASDAKRQLARLEADHASRLGVAVVDTGTGRSIRFRSGERFAFASTNKTFIAAAVLARSTPDQLAEVVHYGSADLLAYAPITSRFVGTGMTVRELIDAMLRFSDNTAANLLVERLGGPSAVEQYLRGLGDTTTNVDRLEPDLNEAAPGDVRDTTTPDRFAADLRSVVLGDALDSTPRAFLRDTMLDNTTGAATIRAGVSTSWPVADKTGTGDRGVRNDIGVVYPIGHDPIVLVVFTAPEDAAAAPDDALVAAATRIAVRSLLR